MTLVTYILLIIAMIVVLSLLNEEFSLILYAAFLYFITAYSNEIFTEAAGTGIQNWVYVFPGVIGTIAIYKIIVFHNAAKGGG